MSLAGRGGAVKWIGDRVLLGETFNGMHPKNGQLGIQGAINWSPHSINGQQDRGCNRVMLCYVMPRMLGSNLLYYIS